MNEVIYPWHWLSDHLGRAFTVRYPWLEAVQRAVRQEPAVCLLIPEMAGEPSSWSAWLADLLDRDGTARCLQAGPSFAEVTEVLVDDYRVGKPCVGVVPGRWADQFLTECRSECRHVDPVPLLVPDGDDACVVGLRELIHSQNRLSYTLTRPVVIRRTLPTSFPGEVVRFGVPEVSGDLNRLSPAPSRDPRFWTDLLLAVTVVWEAGAIPWLAEELWQDLRFRLRGTLSDAGFDDWLQGRLDSFARQHWPGDRPNPEVFRVPAADVDDSLWQSGVMSWQGGWFDATPLRVRAWEVSGNGTGDTPLELLRRRRLTNGPLARWLSAWASSVEESLRLAILQDGRAKFAAFLRTQPPRVKGFLGSRWDELGLGEGTDPIEQAEFSDLARFVARPAAGRSRRQDLTDILDQCRVARNDVVHQRRLSAQAFLQIARAVAWLSEERSI